MAALDLKLKGGSPVGFRYYSSLIKNFISERLAALGIEARCRAPRKARRLRNAQKIKQKKSVG